jgi:hypothetical protein
MSGFCSENSEVITNANYTENFTGTSCLPRGQGFPASSIDSKGVVNSAAMSDHINGLLESLKIKVPIETGTTDEVKVVESRKMNPAEDYAKRTAEVRASIQREYCFYYVRYRFILREILMLAATQSSRQLAGSDYTTKKNKTEELNSKLNQILQIIQAFVNSRNASLRNYYGTETGVNQINKSLDKTREDLLRHSKLLKNKSMEKDLKSAMVDYTVEKNSSSRNLLAIYGFMNIVAAGMIFYLYRSSKSQ